MVLYTSDVDIVYSLVANGIVTSNQVKILSSNRHHTLKLLEDFSDIEEILCVMTCPLEALSMLGDLIQSRKRLKTVSFLIYIPPVIKQKSTQKKRRVIQSPTYQNVMKVEIPELIKNLGYRLKYLFIGITICDSMSSSCTSIILNKGLYNVLSNNSIYSETNNIFSELINTGALRGLTTDGHTEYKIDNITSLKELTIVARTNSENDPINKEYLEKLVAKTKTVTIIYNSTTIFENQYYSNILKRGTCGGLRKINAIIPVSELEGHIVANKDLEEIEVIVRHPDDVEDMKSIMQKYSERDIHYCVHYHKLTDTKYWLLLRGLGDVTFKNIVKSLMTLE